MIDFKISVFTENKGDLYRKIRRDVIVGSDFSKKEKVLYLMLLNYSSATKNFADKLDQSEMADAIDLTTSRMPSALKKLADNGIIEISDRKIGRHIGYQITVFDSKKVSYLPVNNEVFSNFR